MAKKDAKIRTEMKALAVLVRNQLRYARGFRTYMAEEEARGDHKTAAYFEKKALECLRTAKNNREYIRLLNR